ncbi:2-phospho-L-lactate guanylyltransferase [Methanofollis aquaemaris]|uniref:2-phospho-L-lactate guanylyltransferase n=1 Tax=Methanofollis aquaemaris TaxID=126734 RepID=A0A8A3S7Y9_9EURY|nr:2-phospho-L-lactate guanylyltransferase [Methanofollis aquaemaris]QSZ67716.1 2-phospho-L-lactate guanylyltransferase [Methanofollis aquaemaris]
MAIDAIIPFKPKNPKTRLSCIMEQDEREAFARAMLSDVLAAVRAAGCAPTLLSTGPFEHPDARVVVDPAGLNESLNRVLATAQEPVLIIMADLPLATPEAVGRMIGTDAQMAIAPGLGGGTNAIFVKEPSRYHVDYYGASFCKHMAIAAEAGLSCEVTDSFRLHTDVDEKEDLVEVLIHGQGSAACRCLDSLGFALSIERGRVGVERRTHKEAL